VPCALALLGCPSTGGQRTQQLRQSASCHCQVGALSFGSPRSVRAVAGHAAGNIPQSWLVPPLLGIYRKLGYSGTNNRRAFSATSRESPTWPRVQIRFVVLGPLRHFMPKLAQL